MRGFVLIEFGKSSGTREQQNLPSSQTLQEGCGDLVVSSGRQSELFVKRNVSNKLRSQDSQVLVTPLAGLGCGRSFRNTTRALLMM